MQQIKDSLRDYNFNAGALRVILSLLSASRLSYKSRPFRREFNSQHLSQLLLAPFEYTSKSTEQRIDPYRCNSASLAQQTLPSKHGFTGPPWIGSLYMSGIIPVSTWSKLLISCPALLSLRLLFIHSFDGEVYLKNLFFLQSLSRLLICCIFVSTPTHSFSHFATRTSIAKLDAKLTQSPIT